jgi:hypothetical protein
MVTYDNYAYLGLSIIDSNSDRRTDHLSTTRQGILNI